MSVTTTFENQTENFSSPSIIKLLLYSNFPCQSKIIVNLDYGVSIILIRIHHIVKTIFIIFVSCFVLNTLKLICLFPFINWTN